MHPFLIPEKEHKHILLIEINNIFLFEINWHIFCFLIVYHGLLLRGNGINEKSH